MSTPTPCPGCRMYTLCEPSCIVNTHNENKEMTKRLTPEREQQIRSRETADNYSCQVCGCDTQDRLELLSEIDTLRAENTALGQLYRDVDSKRCDLFSEVRQLKAENEELKQRNFNGVDISTHLKSENQKLRARLEKLREALVKVKDDSCCDSGMMLCCDVFQVLASKALTQDDKEGE